MYRLVRSIGFRFEPETAHRMALRAVRLTRPFRRQRRFEVDPVELFGLRFRNRLGLAAGYDKNGTAWRALAALGFGHVEVGTVTPRPQQGNPYPRVHRLPEHQALINRMGFPSAGVDAIVSRLTAERGPGVVLGVSIGPNADTPPERRIDDYLLLVDRLADRADYLAVNVSSPNTPGLRDLEAADAIRALLPRIVDRRDERAAQMGRHVPILVKLSPDIPDFETVVVAAGESGIDGIIVGNTTTTRPDVVHPAPGGLSGGPLGAIALDRLRRAVTVTRLPVIASGGVLTPDDVAARFAAGASLVQLYTGLVYAGPRLVRRGVNASLKP